MILNCHFSLSQNQRADTTILIARAGSSAHDNERRTKHSALKLTPFGCPSKLAPRRRGSCVYIRTQWAALGISVRNNRADAYAEVVTNDILRRMRRTALPPIAAR